MGSRIKFEAEMIRLRSIAPSDFRLWVRGRDFLEFLEYILIQQNIERKLCSRRVLEGIFTMTASLEYLEQFPLFQALGDWHYQI